MTFYADTKEDSGVDEGYLWPFMKEATKFDIKTGEGGLECFLQPVLVGEDSLYFFKNILCQQNFNDLVLVLDILLTNAKRFGLETHQSLYKKS